MSKSEEKKAIQYKDKLLTTIMEQAPFPTFVLDDKGVCVLINKAFIERWGITDKSMIIGKNAFDDPINKKKGTDKLFRKALNGIAVEIPEMSMISPASNKEVTIKSSVFPIFDINNKVVNIAVMQVDITEQKKAEKERKTFAQNLKFLSESIINLFSINNENELYEYLLTHLTKLIDAEIIVVSVYNSDSKRLKPAYIGGNNNFIKEAWNLYGTYESINASKLTSLFPEVLSSNLYEVKNGIHELSFGFVPEEVCLEIESQFEFGKLYSIGLNKNNHLFGCISIILKKGKQIDNKKIIETFIKQVSIILYYKQVEKDLIIAKEKAVASDNLKTAFIANISHEIRTPLHAINGFSKILSTKKIDREKEKQYLQYIVTNCNTLQNLLDDLINISQIESGQLKIHKKNFNVGKLFEDIKEHYSETLKLTNGKVDLIYDVNAETKDLVINSDLLRIKQILGNLLSNAIKYTKEGQIRFGCKIVGNELMFYVKDTGIGIENDKIQIIFERFQWVDNNNQYIGTGLGLSIAKSLSQLLGGEIWVESEINKGSVFYFTIPLDKTNLNTVKKDKAIESLDSKALNWKDKTILIAEDDDFNFLIIHEAIEEANAKILRAKTGYEVLEICKKEKNIDIILMDIQMPVMNGYEASVKVLEHFPDMKIIAQTAYTLENEKSKLLKAGCIDYISKPIDIVEMIQKLDKHLCNNC